MSEWGSKLPRLMHKLIELESRVLRNLERDQFYLCGSKAAFHCHEKAVPLQWPGIILLGTFQTLKPLEVINLGGKKFWLYFACSTIASVWFCSQQRPRFLLRTPARGLPRNHRPQPKLFSLDLFRGSDERGWHTRLIMLVVEILVAEVEFGFHWISWWLLNVLCVWAICHACYNLCCPRASMLWELRDVLICSSLGTFTPHSMSLMPCSWVHFCLSTSIYKSCLCLSILTLLFCVLYLSLLPTSLALSPSLPVLVCLS